MIQKILSALVVVIAGAAWGWRVAVLAAACELIGYGIGKGDGAREGAQLYREQEYQRMIDRGAT